MAAARGVSRNPVSRALAGAAPEAAPEAAPPASGDDAGEAETLTPLARPQPRDEERQAARRGELAEAAPGICEGASLPMAGALLVLPALAATGLLACVEEVYGRAKPAFYGVRSLVLAVVFAALVGEARAEGLTRLDPVDIGRLLGLDRAPEVKTLRRRLEALAAAGRADQLMAALARRHVAAHPEATGVFYVDGHVRAYHGGAEIPKAHVTRMRLSMPATVDTWVADAFGDGVLCWTAPPPASLVGELARVAAAIRDLVGPDRRPTVADHLQRRVPNPAKKPAGARAAEARRRLADIEDDLPERRPAELATAHADAVAYVEGLTAAARGVPARVPLGELHPDAVVHHGERKRIHDAIRMATYNAETSLARLLAPHYPRADDEARSLLRE